MYSSYIGKIFLDSYKQKNDLSSEYTAEQFFDEVMFPIFFNDDYHLLHVGNSPFFQNPSKKSIDKYKSKSLTQKHNLKEKIKSKAYSGAIYVGYGAEDIKATTSAQMSDIDYQIDSEEIYLSWIGAGLGIGVAGGLVILINKIEILWAIFEGWQIYRNYLEHTPDIKDKQIETWNGHWICKRLGSNKTLEEDKDEFYITTGQVLGKLAIQTNNWSKIIYVLSKYFKNHDSKVLTLYIYNLSQTNTTLGFINLYLSEVNEIFEVRDKYFINEKETILSDEYIMEFETFYNLKSASKFGSIGLKSLEPKQLREFLPKGTFDYSQGKDVKHDNNKNFIYKLWIYAMLNKKELLEIADNFADILFEYENQKDVINNRGKTGKTRNIKDILDSNSIKNFIEKLSEMIPDLKDNLEFVKKLQVEVLKMPIDNFPLFITLIKFQYNYLKNKEN